MSTNYPNNPTVGQRFTLPSGILMECEVAPVFDGGGNRISDAIWKAVIVTDARAEDAADRAEAAADSAEAAATSAEESEAIASQAAIVAENSAISAENNAVIAEAVANFKGAWSGLTGVLSVPASVIHKGNYWTLLSNTANVALIEPGVSTQWALVPSIESAKRLEAIKAKATFLADFVRNEFKVWEPPYGQEPKTITQALTTTRASEGTVNTPFGVQTRGANIARIEYDPLTGEPLGLLCEEQRTNLLLRSEDFSNVSWVNTRASITSGVTVAPDGTLTGDKLVEDTTANDTHFIEQNTAGSNSGAFTFSCYAKAGERAGITLAFTGGNAFTPTVLASFNLASGVLISVSVTNSASATITPAGNGWYRVTFTATTDISGALRSTIRINNGTTSSYTGDGTSGIFIWGAQLEAGSFPTSYIPTGASAVTRVNEYSQVISVQQSPEITIVFNVFDRVPTSTPSGRNASMFSLTDGTGSNRLTLRRDALTTVNLLYDVEGVSNVISVSAFNRAAFNKVAVRVTRLGVVSLFINGVRTNNVTSANPKMIQFNRLDIGNDRAQSFSRYDGVFQNFETYPRALSDTELQELTKL